MRSASFGLRCEIGLRIVKRRSKDRATHLDDAGSATNLGVAQWDFRRHQQQRPDLSQAPAHEQRTGVAHDQPLAIGIPGRRSDRFFLPVVGQRLNSIPGGRGAGQFESEEFLDLRGEQRAQLGGRKQPGT